MALSATGNGHKRINIRLNDITSCNQHMAKWLWLAHALPKVRVLGLSGAVSRVISYLVWGEGKMYLDWTQVEKLHPKCQKSLAVTHLFTGQSGFPLSILDDINTCSTWSHHLGKSKRRRYVCGLNTGRENCIRHVRNVGMSTPVFMGKSGFPLSHANPRQSQHLLYACYSILGYAGWCREWSSWQFTEEEMVSNDLCFWRRRQGFHATTVIWLSLKVSCQTKTWLFFTYSI
jgi:hypothetical protein